VANDTFGNIPSRVRNEPRPLGVDVTIAKATLVVREETPRHHKMKLILGSVIAT
jgi:hypothetical protein